jgi:hypothetical protein
MITALNPHPLSADATQLAVLTVAAGWDRKQVVVRGDLHALAARCLR